MMIVYVKKEMEIMSSFLYLSAILVSDWIAKSVLQPLNHQSLKGTVNYGMQLCAANGPFLCLLRDNRNIKNNDDMIDLAC